MNKTYILAIVAALVAAPLALAHNPAGTPKNYCEGSSEWFTHDYGPVASGRLLYGNEDGNLGGDCVTGHYVNGPSATPCADSDWSFSVEEDPVPATYVCVNPPVADWDGHNEFAFGGAWLLVTSGPGVPSADPSVGAGTLYCFGAAGHHANFATVTVTDLVLGAGVNFRVASDTSDLTGTGEGCGDFQSDNGQDCTGSCPVTFEAGLDGAYVVFVQVGTAGHVETN